MAEVLVETDVLIDHLRGARRLQSSTGTFAYSVITRTELLAGRATDEERVRTLLAPMREIAVDRAVAERAGALRRTLPILTPDALIAATALEAGLPLMTRNRRDYAAVPGLTIVKPGDPTGA